MGAVCAASAWFPINLVCIYLHQRRVAARWNMTYEPGSPEAAQKALSEVETKITKMEARQHG